MIQYEPVIGLEVHAELLTESKMFCGCRVVDSVAAAPNTAVCPVCLGMPGMLPVLNQRAVAFALRVGLALNCRVNAHNHFARKNYFYPDLPKAYQITQSEAPLCVDGFLDIELPEGSLRRIRVRRVHMEEDTGKLTHLDEGGSLVDYNRSGVPLLEIVSEPDMFSVEEMYTFAIKIRQILRYLEVNSGDMEKGVIRFEANVSVRPVGSQELGTRTEVKNLNSFRALTAAANYEIERQSALLAAGGIVAQATLGWHEGRQETFSQRSKEDAHDYRYFPEPDLPPLVIDPEWAKAIQTKLPELPAAKIARFRATYNLSAGDAALLAEDRPVAQWFDALVRAGVDPGLAANWVLNNLFSLMNEHKQTIDEVKVKPAAMAELLALLSQRALNNNQAKAVLAEMFDSGRSAPQIVAARGLTQITDAAAITTVVTQIVNDNLDQVAAYRAGKTQLRGWFVGQVMRKTRGQADPAIVNEILDQLLHGGASNGTA